MRIFPASGNRKVGLGPVFRPFTNSDQYRFLVTPISDRCSDVVSTK